MSGDSRAERPWTICDRQPTFASIRRDYLSESLTTKSELDFKGEYVANRYIKSGLVVDDSTRIPGRLRTAKEARELLEELRNTYQSLTPEEKRGVKGFMSDLLEQQRRFGTTERDQWH